MSLKILILGVNGFIGNSLMHAVLRDTNWEIFGMDIASDKLDNTIEHERFHFLEGDIDINKEWVEYHIKKCNVVLPLVAIATPSLYVSDPLRVFELDFEANLQIIRQALRYNTRVIFPSTSEVYGMCDDREFNEQTSKFIQGPIHKERWIYSCCKQLMDRVIYAYSQHDNLQFTLFRPFNWIGPKQDSIYATKEGSSRVVTQFISNIIHNQDIKLVNGGKQHRSFTYIDDGIKALMKIIENKDNCAAGRIFNLGNPKNDVSIAELAVMILDMVKDYPNYQDIGKRIKITTVNSEEYYGIGYDDMSGRVPSIKNAKKYLDWKPSTDLKTALRNTLDYYLLNPEHEI